MRKICLLLTALMAVTAVSCAEKFTGESGIKLLDKEGIAPYALSEGESYLLNTLGIQSQILSFHAPKEAVGMEIRAYRLNESSVWEQLDGGNIVFGKEGEPLIGTYAMVLKEHHALEFHVRLDGTVVSETEELFPDAAFSSSASSFLGEFQEIEIGKEIPVAAMVYDDESTIMAFPPKAFSDPAPFANMELVQAVTLTFFDEMSQNRE